MICESRFQDTKVSAVMVAYLKGYNEFHTKVLTSRD
jgi:hypothetical protein